MPGSSDGKDLLPDMLRGSAGAKSLLIHGSADFSGFHVALLWVGSSVAAVGKLLPAFLFTYILVRQLRCGSTCKGNTPCSFLLPA